jgi:hypothetical protein
MLDVVRLHVGRSELGNGRYGQRINPRTQLESSLKSTAALHQFQAEITIYHREVALFIFFF